MDKKGDIWISAVIYIALGVIILSLVLAVGIPTIQKMKDNAVAKQTKELMLTIDNNIRTVYNEGPGSQRQVKVKIGSGTFDIDQVNEIITWQTRTKAILSEPDVDITEGNLIIRTQTSVQKGEYDLILTLEYPEIDITYDGIGSIKGTSLLSIINNGPNNEVPQKTNIAIVRR
jgi:type II secretory pathway pseudopilin PulG